MTESYNRGKNAASKRWGSVTKADVELRIARLRDAADKFASIKLIMDAFDFDADEEIRIDGATKWERAIEEIESYAQLVEKGVITHKQMNHGKNVVRG